MGLRYSKRVNFGNGLGLNISKSGISPSFRTKWGSFGSKYYSFRTGIPGLTYRGGSGKNAGLTWFIIMLIAGVFILMYYAVIILINLVIFIFNSMFDDEGNLCYTNLIILLSIISIFLLFVYFNLPVNK